MARYEITAPNGKRYEVSAPDDASEQDVLGFAEQNYQSAPQIESKVAQPMVQQPPSMNPVLKGAGMAARTAVGAATSLLDAPRLFTDPVNKVVANLASKSGNTALAEGARDAYNTPYISDTAKGVIDDFTGDRFKPQSDAEKAVNTVGEIGLSMAGGSIINRMAGQKALQGGARQATESLSNAIAKKASKTIPTAESRRVKANTLYKSSDELGGILRPHTVDGFLDRATESFSPKTELGKLLDGEGKAAEVMQKLELGDEAKGLKGLRGRTLNLQEAQDIDEYLGGAIDDLTELGKPTKEALKLIKIQDELRRTILGATETDIVGSKDGFKALADGRKAWSEYVKLRDVERIISRAQNMEQPVTALKNGFNSLLNNPNRLRGFNARERAAIAKAAKVGAVTDILKTMGSRLNPIIAQSVGIGVGGSTGGWLGAAAGSALSYGASTGARNLANKMQMNKAQNVQRAIAGIEKPKGNLPKTPLYGLIPALTGDE